MKKQNTISIIIISISFIICFVLGWYVIDSLLLGIVFGILIGLGIFYAIKLQVKKKAFYKHIKVSYDFVNLLNVAMLSTSNIYEAYKSIEQYLDDDLTNIASDDLIDTLNDIANDYDINAFKMYIKTITIFDNDGGNFKEMEKIPSSLMQKTKIHYQNLEKRKLSKLIEISSLYLLWIFVLIFLKASIPNYYSQMMENVGYQFLMLFILCIGAGLNYLAILNYFKTKIRGL